VRVRLWFSRSACVLPAGFLLLLTLRGACAQSSSLQPGPPPQDASAQQKEWIGDYGPDGPMLTTVAEKDGQLILVGERLGQCNLTRKSSTELTAACPGGSNVALVKDRTGVFSLRTAEGSLERRDFGVDVNQVARIHPVRPVAELRREALQASPPQEAGPFRQPDLVELAPLDAAIHLDIRYATSNDFLGTPVYTQARAFLERPAAEALLRAHKKLQLLGYGLLIHDAYRPWYVTKIFWDATPPEGKIFVADPSQGSRHNRGCAVDLTLYDLGTGKPIEMPGTYDEMSPRSYPNYAGGTSLERWHRDLLRRVMESEGFAVYEFEWWHFDFKDWREYPILNITFEKLSPAPARE
jgi:D-alanyl-D-alanine dipeptidase